MLHRQHHDPAIATLHDEIDFVAAATSPEVSDPSLGGFRVDSQRKDAQGLEEGIEQGPVRGVVIGCLRPGKFPRLSSGQLRSRRSRRLPVFGMAWAEGRYARIASWTVSPIVLPVSAARAFKAR